MSEGSSFFWKAFGGAIIGLVVVLLGTSLTLINNNVNTSKSELMFSMSQTKSEIQTEVSKLRDDITIIKTKMAGVDEFREALRDKTSTLENGLKERTQYSESNVNTLREKDKDHDAKLGTILERLIKLEEKMKTEPKL